MDIMISVCLRVHVCVYVCVDLVRLGLRAYRKALCPRQIRRRVGGRRHK